jgi:hypothetical protein
MARDRELRSTVAEVNYSIYSANTRCRWSIKFQILPIGERSPNNSQAQLGGPPVRLAITVVNSVSSTGLGTCI